MDAYATVADLAAGWADYDESMEQAANTMLGRVSLRLRIMCVQAGSWRDPDADEDWADILRDVVCEVVRRALSAQGIADGAPVSQFTETATPYSNSYIFSNASGDLYLSKFEKEMLGLVGGRAAFAPLVAP